MKYFFLIVVSAFVMGCATTKSNSDKAIFIQEFKMHYFKSSLKYGFKNTPEINAILSTDGSTSSELILGNAEIFVDSVAKARNSDLIKTFPKGTKAEGTTGNPIFKKILDDYQSSWLNSLAKDAYRKFNQ